MPNAQDVLDSMEQIDNLSVGDLMIDNRGDK